MNDRIATGEQSHSEHAPPPAPPSTFLGYHERWCSPASDSVQKVRGLFRAVDDPGDVYVLSNPGMPGLLKIGFTTNPVQERVQQLNTTGVPHPFAIDAIYESENPHRDEQRVRALMEPRRVNDRREFFRADTLLALAAISEVMGRGPSILRPEVGAGYTAFKGGRAPSPSRAPPCAEQDRSAPERCAAAAGDEPVRYGAQASHRRTPSADPRSAVTRGGDRTSAVARRGIAAPDLRSSSRAMEHWRARRRLPRGHRSNAPAAQRRRC